MNKKIATILLIFLSFNSLYSESLINTDEKFYTITARSELGLISILNHTFMNGSNGTNFNYKTQGGQDILFPYNRFELTLEFEKHVIRLLYQPLEIVTNVNFRESVTVDDVIFAKGTPMELTYSFPFWRTTYFYNFSTFKDLVLAAGLSLQIRDASIRFKEISGKNITVSQNVGPVPAISLYTSKKFTNGVSIAFDATGSYASSSFFNGSTFNFEGSLLDASLTAGFELKNNITWLITARFIGGSAKGNSQYTGRTWSESLAPYTDNQLATFVLSTGVLIE